MVILSMETIIMEEPLYEVVVGKRVVRWYRDLGYTWEPKDKGPTYANGTQRAKSKRYSYAGQTIWVKAEHLSPSSTVKVQITCSICNKTYLLPNSNASRKITSKCASCHQLENLEERSTYYLTKELITNNPDAKCNISGETDKRFLVLHHLLSESNGGKSTRENLVVITANYHQAFHLWMGSTQVPCTPEDYYRFKEQEMPKVTEMQTAGAYEQVLRN